MTDSALGTALAELSREAGQRNVRFFLAGGYGVLLRVQTATVRAEQTLAEPPTARTTLDLDLLLHPEVLASGDRMRSFRACLEDLGYEENESAKYYQFTRGRGASMLKVDLHAKTPSDRTGVKVSDIRVRSRDFKLLHGRRLDEAIGHDLRPVPISLGPDGLVAAGETEVVAEVLTPNLLTYLSLKAVALRDRIEEGAGQDHGRRHAYDMYALWACANEQEWNDAIEVVAATAAEPEAKGIREAVKQLFADEPRIGYLRLQEAFQAAGVQVAAEDMERFLDDLGTLFGPLEP